MKTKQITPVFVPARFQQPKRAKRAGNVLPGIDRKHSKPKLLTIRHELPYAFPANIGNARNPLVFGKIPQAYVDKELRENAASLHSAGLLNTNKQNHLARVRKLNFRLPNLLTPELQDAVIKAHKARLEENK